MVSRGQLISVEQRHIDKGVIFDCQYCPVGLAVSEASGGKLVSVGAMAIQIWQGAKHLEEYDYYHVPRRVRQFIQRYDCVYLVQPIKFYLRKIATS